MFQKYRASGSLWLLLVLFNSGFIQAAVYIVRPMITYRSVELGADSALVGAVGATFALAPLLFAIPIGRWVDRGRAGFALFAGAGISLLTAFSLLFINSIPLLMLAMPMLGIGHLLTMVGGQTMIANRSQDAKLEKNFGLLTFYASLGQAIGPFTGGVLADTGTIQVNTNAAIGFAAILFAFAVLTTIPLVRGTKAEAAKVAGNTKGSVRQVLGLPNFKSAIFVASAITAVIDVVLIFLPLLGRELGLTTTEVGLLLAVRSLSSMGVRLVLGQITNRFGMKWVLNGGSIVTLLSCLAIATVTNFWLLLAIMAISGFAMGIGQPATMAWVTRISTAEHRGLAISVRLTANRLGQVAVPTVAGVVAGGGVGAVFFMLAALQAASIVATARALGDSD
jgi:MFS family permease